LQLNLVQETFQQLGCSSRSLGEILNKLRAPPQGQCAANADPWPEGNGSEVNTRSAQDLGGRLAHMLFPPAPISLRYAKSTTVAIRLSADGLEGSVRCQPSAPPRRLPSRGGRFLVQAERGTWRLGDKASQSVRW